MGEFMSRNALCDCGSGKRYKHCHGLVEVLAQPSAAHLAALAAHREGALRRADALYRQALQANPADVESLHMLGVVQFERMRYPEALALLQDAAERTGWAVALIRHNLGLVLAKLMGPHANARQEALVAAYLARERARIAGPATSPRVSVVLPVCNDAQSVARAIGSVAAQTYADIELVVVDAGSTDGTVAAVEACTAELPLPVTFVRDVRGGIRDAANEGARRAAGGYLAFLSAGDAFAPQHVARMVAEIARDEPLWGFSQVGQFDEHVRGAAPAPRTGDDDALRRARNIPTDEPASFALLHRDIAAASGNLFIERALFLSLGGYRDASQHGWDLCVRAAKEVEPVVVREPLYLRPHETLDRPESRRPGPAAAEKIARGLVDDALSGVAPVKNPLCPQYPDNRVLVLRAELRAGRGEHLPVPLLRALATELRASTAVQPPRAVLAPVRATDARTALVVLGPYRSGTSAFARALNLCGAMLPEGLVPARLGVNPTGFWETESINDLDARLLYRLGGDWNRVDMPIPSGGPLVDEFEADVGELLAGEYQGASLIVIKDPRICVLAPLWHRALERHGYRARYVVPVRNPLEVARSLESRGDMPVGDGLLLWLAYMRHVESFTRHAGIAQIHVRYTELLADWRAVVGRIGSALHIELDTQARAGEIDSFIAPALRNQAMTDDDLARHVMGESGQAVTALYARLLARCRASATSLLEFRP